jgi:hypothetical protein
LPPFVSSCLISLSDNSFAACFHGLPTSCFFTCFKVNLFGTCAFTLNNSTSCCNATFLSSLVTLLKIAVMVFCWNIDCQILIYSLF